MQKIIMYLFVTLQSIIENMQVIGILRNKILGRVRIKIFFFILHAFFISKCPPFSLIFSQWYLIGIMEIFEENAILHISLHKEWSGAFPK